MNQKPNSTKGTSPVTTLTPSQLAELLRASAADFSDGYAAEAAAHLLTRHRSLLTRVDRGTRCRQGSTFVPSGERAEHAEAPARVRA